MESSSTTPQNITTNTKSAEPTTDPCHLALQSFAALDVVECCPLYSKLVKMEDPAAPSKDNLGQLQRELELLVQSTTYRIKKLTEEYQKADSYVKASKESTGLQIAVKPSSASASQQASAPQTPTTLQSTIKLDLKKLKAEGLLVDDVKTAQPKKKQQRRDSAIPKRKRSESNAVETTGDRAESVAGKEGTPETTDFILKKKRQRKEQEQKQPKAASQEPSETPVPQPSVEGESQRIKPAQQIPITTFWNHVDAYFRNVTEEDLRVLECDEIESQEPYLIPPLGKFYRDRWAEEDRKANTEKRRQKSIAPQPVDDSGISSDQYCGKLTERLLSALIEEDPEQTSQIVQGDDGDKPSVASGFTVRWRITEEELYSIEERMKRELRVLGLLEEDEGDGEDNDEITQELQRLQEEFRAVSAVNRERKSIVYERAVDQMAYQEYRLVLDELDKQVEQAFFKRQKLMTKRRKKIPGVVLAPDGVVSLLEKRRKLIDEFSPIFTDETILLPSTSIFNDDASIWLKEVSLQPPPPPPVPKSTKNTSVHPSPILSEAPLSNIQPSKKESSTEKNTRADAQSTNDFVEIETPIVAKPSATESKPRKKYTKKSKSDAGDGSVSQPRKRAAPKKERKKKDSEDAMAVDPKPSTTSTPANNNNTADNGDLGVGSLLPDWMFSSGMGPV